MLGAGARLHRHPPACYRALVSRTLTCVILAVSGVDEQAQLRMASYMQRLRLCRHTRTALARCPTQHQHTRNLACLCSCLMLAI
jgi:hypothetical protein